MINVFKYIWFSQCVFVFMYPASDVLRILAAESIELARSGHPGMPLGMADIATVLYHSFMRHNPNNPHWVNRDRFILSNGHGSMLQYAVLHLTGYDLSIDDLKSFRRLGSKTPGHPEYPEVPGVEATTGPLGQGLANAVGIALAQKHLGERFNRPGLPILDYFTYVFSGDGCLMEGISHEASSLAGQWSLGHLIMIWDDNGISIDGKTASWFSEDVCQRYLSYGWHVIDNVDGHDPIAIHQAVTQARLNLKQPTLIQCQTTIGFGSPNLAGCPSVHGKPLGASEMNQLRNQLNWTHEPFSIPSSIYDQWDAKAAGKIHNDAWLDLWSSYQSQYPEAAKQLELIWQGRLPDAYNNCVDHHRMSWLTQDRAMATRQASNQVIDALAQSIPQLIGGSADLTESNLTKVPYQIPFHETTPQGTYLHYGVREFAMFAIANGLSVSHMIPYVGTFLVFMDYGRNAMRMAAMMRLRVIFILTHDSIGLGEDGPSHQPVEHLAIARLTPNLNVWRPADLAETAAAWHHSLLRVDGPSAIVLSRQSVPPISHQESDGVAMTYGAYAVYGYQDSSVDCLILATGTEVSLAISVAQRLSQSNYICRVVSVPCLEIFMQQPVHDRTELLSAAPCQVVIEAASQALWERCLNRIDLFFGIDDYGLSAPGPDVYEHFGLTEMNISTKIFDFLTEIETCV